MARTSAAISGAAVTALTIAALAGCGGGSTSTSEGEVGAPSVGSVAFEFTGHIDQDGHNFSGYGYLTHIAGLDDSKLFTGTVGPGTAHFTIVIRSAETSRSKLNNLTVVSTAGTGEIRYADSPGADFSNPASFSQGAVVAAFAVRGQNILSIDPDNRDKGVAAATAELTQRDASSFQFDGATHHFGHQNLTERMSVTGEGRRTDPNVPRSVIEIAGDMVVTGGAA